MLNDLFKEGGSKAIALENLLNYIKSYYADSGVKYDVTEDQPLIEHVLMVTYSQLRKLKNPSVFKKLGAFTQNFVFTSPINCELPESIYPPEIPRRWYHNAVISFAVSRRCLHRAVITCEENGETKKKPLNNLIDISRHQHRDLMTALCRVDDIKGDVPARFISLIYETLAYEFNDDIRYPPSKHL